MSVLQSQSPTPGATSQDQHTAFVRARQRCKQQRMRSQTPKEESPLNPPSSTHEPHSAYAVMGHKLWQSLKMSPKHSMYVVSAF